MTTYVLGAGIVGVTTAYFLAKAGHQVTVIDAANSIGTAATNSNAGMISPSDAVAWASPEAPLRMLGTLTGRTKDVQITPAMFSRYSRWGLEFLRECTAQRHTHNTLSRLEMCLYSQRTMNELASAEQLEYDQTVDQGILYVYRDATPLAAAAERARLLADHGHQIVMLSADEVVEREPALRAQRGNIAGAAYGVTDATGDARLFTIALAKRCEALGVRFELGVRIKSLEVSNNRVVAAHTDQGRHSGEAFVLCLGSGSAAVARTAGLRLPILPVKGYCVDYPIRSEGVVPQMSGVDERNLVAWSRLGDRLRFTTGAEFGATDSTVTEKALAPIRRTIAEMFPTAADYGNGDVRTGLRPVTPAGSPLVGSTRRDGLYLNTGHGSMGWTMGCGSARVISDLMTGRQPAIGGVGSRG